MQTTKLHRAIALSAIVATSALVPANAANLVWIGGTGQWNAAANWSPAQVPSAADNAFITNSGTYTVSIANSVDPTVASLTLGGSPGAQTLSLGRSVLTLNGASVVNPNGQLVLTVGNSTVTGPGNLAVNGALNWASGTISGAGALSIGNSGVVTVNGGVTLSGRTMSNTGHVTWNSGNLTIDTGAVINNLPGGIFDVAFDGRLSVGSAPASISNSGLFRKTAGAATANLTAPFNNSGLLQALAGTLSLDGGGNHTGTISNAPGTTVNFGGGSHVLAAGSLVTGAGTVAVSGNATTLSAGGTFDVTGARLNVTAGVATLAPGCNVTGATLNVSGGTLNFNSAGTVAVVNLSSGTLGGSSPVTVTGPLTLGGGTITSPVVTANGGLTINGNTTLNGGKLINPVTAVWSAGSFTGANGAVVSNLFGATFINTFDGNAPSGAGATPIFYNAGLFQKTNGTAALGNTSIDYQFINTGRVEVRTNTVRYNFNQQTAGLTLLNGGGLAAQAQPIQILGGSLVGTGLVSVANLQNVVNSAEISPGLPLGRLDINGNYQQTASGVLNIDLGGYLAGTNFDLITVTAGGAGGVATLGGTLNLSLTNGFSPTNGATFTFLTALSRAGVFATVNYPSNDIGLVVSYDLTSAKVTVSNLKPVVSAAIPNPAPITYGAGFNLQLAANTFTDPDNTPLTYSASGLPPGVSFASDTRTFSGTPTQAGVFLVTVTARDGGVPSLAAGTTFTLTVNPAVLSVTAESKTKTYGAADPAPTFTVNGLQPGDTASSVLSGALTRAAGETVAGGPYAITRGTLAASGNYTLNFTGSALTISKAPLAVNAEAKTKVYGAADPALTATFSGFVNGETPAVLGGTLSVVRVAGEKVGSYVITPAGLTSANYAISFNPGTLAIIKAVLSVTADPKTKVYGTAEPTFTATYSGFVNNDTPTAFGGTLIFTRAPGEGVGSYLIAPGGITSGNYTITFHTGTLTITAPAPSILSITGARTGNALITWSAVSNVTYRVQFKSDLNATNWTNLAGDITATGGTASKSDSTSGNPSRFYRIQVLP